MNVVIRRAPSTSALAVGVVGALTVLLAVAAVGWALLAGRATSPVPTADETSFAVASFAIDRFTLGSAHLAWYAGGVGALQVAGYATVTGAFGRAGSVVLAAREPMIVASLLTALAVAAATRRLRLSVPATVAAIGLFGLPPAAVLLHRTADPTNLAMLWTCAALALSSGGFRRPGTVVATAGYLVLAVATAPVVLIALLPLSAHLLWTGAVGRLHGWRRHLVGGAGVAGWSALAALAAHRDVPFSAPQLPVPPLTGLDAALLVAVAAAMVGAVWVRWLQPFAVAVLATAIAAVLAAPVRGALLVVALPLAAVLVAGAAEAAVTHWLARSLDRSRRAGRHEQAGRRRLLVPAGAVALLAVAAVLIWLPSARELRGSAVPGEVSADAARDWVLVNLPSRPRLAVDDMLWATLIQAGYPADRLAAVRGIGPARAGWPDAWSGADFVVGRDQVLLAAPVGDLARQAREHSSLVAAFGSGDAAVDVRRVVTDAAAAGQARPDAAARAAAGQALAGNPHLALAPDAAALLRAGAVDARLLSVLAALSAQHSLSIAGFPVVDGEDDRLPRRLVEVAVMDGQPVLPGGTLAGALGSWLAAQQPPYRPASTTVVQSGGRRVVLIRYDALGRSGLLPPP